MDQLSFAVWMGMREAYEERCHSDWMDEEPEDYEEEDVDV